MLSILLVRSGRTEYDCQGRIQGTLDVPLSEDAESYEVDILDGASVVRTLTASTPGVVYAAAEQTADFGSAQPSYDIRVYQLSSSYGRGTPRAATV